MSTETDALGNRTALTYDGAGRLETQTDETTGAVSTFAYDAAGNLVRHTDAEDGETTYTYVAGELVSG